MHTIEPYFNWRHLYIASEDPLSPLFNYVNSETEFTHTIYNYYIHPQWDFFGSATLYIKILYTNYPMGYCIIELLGEWNDCLYNDIMYLKREITDVLIENKINKFILIGENVLNFHASDYDYYQEWFEDVEDGWIAFINFRPHVVEEFSRANIDYYLAIGGDLNDISWRTGTPMLLFQRVNNLLTKRLNP